jgi:hypothetical protein
MISRSRWIDSTGNFDLYEMPFRAFRDIADSLAGKISGDYSNLPLFTHNGIRSNRSAQNYLFVDFDSLSNSAAMDGKGCFEGKAKNRNILFTGNLPSTDSTRSFSISFWINNVRSDLYSRTLIFYTEKDSVGNTVIDESYQAFRKFISIEGNWALVQINIRAKNPSDKIELALQNSTLRNKKLQADNLLIVPEGTTIYRKTIAGFWRDNRLY